MTNGRVTQLFVASITAILLTSFAVAQGKYPDHPVKVIVAPPAGGSVGTIARSLGQKLNTSLEHPFIIDNRAGASVQIGMPIVAKAAADRHTLTVSPASFLATNKGIFKVLPYDPEADFAPVSRLP